MQGTEYQAVRKITGVYRGSSHWKLGKIGAVEPLQTKLGDLSIAWAARHLKTRGRQMRSPRCAVGKRPHPMALWPNTLRLQYRLLNNVSMVADPHCQPQRTVIRSPRGYPSGTRTPHTAPESEGRKVQIKSTAVRRPGGLLTTGWRLSFTDGTGHSSRAAGAVFSKDRQGGEVCLSTSRADSSLP